MVPLAVRLGRYLLLTGGIDPSIVGFDPITIKIGELFMSNMVNYETLMLARTEITDDELSGLERQLDKIVSSRKGKMTLFDRWGKYKLAYPVQKNVYGIYVLSRFQVPEAGLGEFFKEIDTLFRIKYNEVVMRHVTTKLDGEVSSSYKHPEPIDSHGGTSNLDSFIKENKMEGLIDTPVEKSAPAEKTEKAEEPKVEETVEEVEVPEEPKASEEPAVSEEPKEEEA